MAITDSFDRVVTNMMARFGTNATILVQDDSAAVYDPATGSYTNTNPTLYVVRAIFLDYTLQRNGLSDANGTLIQTGDKQCFVQPINKFDSTLTMPVVQPNKDRLQVGSKIYKIASLKKVDPSMDNAVLFELHLKE